LHLGLALRLFQVETNRIRRLGAYREWILNCAEFPTVEVTFQAEGRTPLRVRMDCTGSPSEPVSFHLLKADGTALPPGPSPEIHPNPTGVLHVGPHTREARPFICTPGSREYHTHDSHLEVSWDSYRARDGFNPTGMLTQVWRAWQKGSG
jgi:hypothetical protein